MMIAMISWVKLKKYGRRLLWLKYNPSRLLLTNYNPINGWRKEGSMDDWNNVLSTVWSG